MVAEPQKTAFISLIGAPNAGKSTLLNRLVGSKVSIVTPKVQTTRSRITGIVIEKNAQLIFIDTPGIFTPRRALDKAMVKTAWSSMQECDYCVVLVDTKRGICDDTKIILQTLKEYRGSKILVLNKIDLVPKEILLPLSQQINDIVAFDHSFMLSASKRDGVDDLRSHLAQHAKEEPWPYPEDQASTIPIRMLAAEITREKLMLHLQQELPYQLMVATEKWEEKSPTKKEPEGSVVIHQVVVVARESHKKIIVGKAGQTLKKIGEMARKELTYLLGQPVHLFLFVKLDADWQSSREYYSMIGLEYEN